MDTADAAARYLQLIEAKRAYARDYYQKNRERLLARAQEQRRREGRPQRKLPTRLVARVAG